MSAPALTSADAAAFSLTIASGGVTVFPADAVARPRGRLAERRRRRRAPLRAEGTAGQTSPRR